jgi:epoxyqueuosine reductase QueG
MVVLENQRMGGGDFNMIGAIFQPLEALRAAAANWGLNLLGVVDAERYDARAPAPHRISDVWPAARTAVVIGSAGPAFWDRFIARVRGTGPIAAGPDPLDAHTVDIVEPLAQMVRAQGHTVRAVYPFYGAAGHSLSFQKLSIEAGFGVDSVLGLVLHPKYGPWVAARAALLTDALLPASGPLSGFDPCGPCPAPCITACPGSAFPERRWSAPRCLEAKRALEACRASCSARLHCVYGREHRYAREEMAYHSSLPGDRARLWHVWCQNGH